MVWGSTRNNPGTKIVFILLWNRNIIYADFNTYIDLFDNILTIEIKLNELKDNDNNSNKNNS